VRPGVDADFSFTNSLGIRADFEIGPLTIEAMYNVFPFENTITVMFLSGTEVRDTLDFVARKSSDRGCRAQVQLAGISFKMICGPNARAEEIVIGDGCRDPNGDLIEGKCAPLIESALYRVAVNDYIAAGGSGFEVLKRNTSKINTGIALRAATIDYMRSLTACDSTLVDGTLPPGDNRTVEEVYGPITCLDETVEAHDGRILPAFE
jgi:5'-nucleotidase